MRLYIAEKPSLGRALAEALPGPRKNEKGFIRVGGGDIVSWCIGHLLEQAPPEAYDSELKRWDLNSLPIVPERWQWQAKRDTQSQLGVLKTLIRQASSLVHVGDPDREGQLLVDEVLHYLEIPDTLLASTLRCLVHDLNPAGIRQALSKLQPNAHFRALSTSALARSRADWLWGINLTRACTLHGQKVGYRGVLSVGRVQTPVLGLVVARDREIEAFESRPFFEVWAKAAVGDADEFWAKWQPSEACSPYQDEEGRVLSQALADKVVASVSNAQGQVLDAAYKVKKQAPPLPYNLSALQIDAAKIHGMSAKSVLDLCQSLYESHKLITYPRSDCRYLPEAHFADAQKVLGAAQVTLHTLSKPPKFLPLLEHADHSLRGRVWSDKNVGAHHAIVPTAKQGKMNLREGEAKIYALICRQYAAQFFPHWRFNEQQIDLELAGGRFRARAKVTIDEGWRALFPARNERESSDEKRFHNVTLPKTSLGETAMCRHAERNDKTTQPPKSFTDATLLAAMTGIARFVRDAKLRAVLKETDGLGTEATRAGILELLFQRRYLERKGKQIRSTAAGRAFIAALPQVLREPDLTARWESALGEIAAGEEHYKGFMATLTQSLPEIIASIEPTDFAGLRGLAGTSAKPSAKKRGTKGRASSTQGRRTRARKSAVKS